MANATDCPLSKLPTEPRLYIYQLALTKQGTIWARPDITVHGQLIFRLSHYNTEPPLTLTCTEIQREALPLYFATNTFGFYYPRRCAWKTLGKLAPYMQHLKNIEVDVDCKHQLVYTVDLQHGIVGARTT